MAEATEQTGTDPALEELVFLARSRHRMALLRALSTDERTRRELETSTGISQPTLGRILGDFEERQWVSNEHTGAYTLTPLGALLASVVEDLVTVLNSSSRLAVLAEDLPLDRLGFDLRHLASARVTTPTESDPMAHLRRFDELAAGAANVQVISNVLSCAPGTESAAADREFLTDVDELVVTADALQAGGDEPSLRRWIGDRLDAGELDLYSTDDSVPFLLGVFDETVGLVPIDDAGMPVGLLETSTPAVLEWSREWFDELRKGASGLTPDEVVG